MKEGSKGFTFIELIAVVTIMFLLLLIVLSSLSSYKVNQAFSADVEQVATVLRTARSQTLASKGASQYGVHVESSKVVLFIGTSYSSSASTNKNFLFSSGDITASVSLQSGGSDIIFKRLSGEVANSGTVTVSSAKASRSKTITIYKTGLIEFQ